MQTIIEKNPYWLLMFFSFIVLASLLAAYGVSASSSRTVVMAVAAIIVLVVSFFKTEAALYILIFAMLLSPEIGISGGERIAEDRSIVVRVEDLLLLLISISWFAKTAIYKDLGLFLKTPLNKPILAYVLICLFSTLLGVFFGRVGPTSGFFYVLKYVEYFVVFFILLNHLQSKEQAKKLVGAALFVSFIISLYAIYQIPSGGRVTAPFEGNHGEPNTLGGYLVLIICIAGGIFLKSETRKENIVLSILLFLLGFAFLFTLSRGSWLAGLAVYLAFCVFSKRRHFLIWGLAVFFIIGPFILPGNVKERLDYTFTQPVEDHVAIGNIHFDTSTSERLMGWRDSMKAFPNHPILGYGVTGWRFIDAQYVRTMVELGVAGLLIFLWLLLSLLRESWKVYLRANDPYFKGLALGFFISVIGMIIHSVGANTFIIIRIMEPFWFFAGIVMLIPNLEKRADEQAILSQ